MKCTNLYVRVRLQGVQQHLAEMGSAVGGWTGAGESSVSNKTIRQINKQKCGLSLSFTKYQGYSLAGAGLPARWRGTSHKSP